MVTVEQIALEQIQLGNSVFFLFFYFSNEIKVVKRIYICCGEKNRAHVKGMKKKTGIQTHETILYSLIE